MRFSILALTTIGVFVQGTLFDADVYQLLKQSIVASNAALMDANELIRTGFNLNGSEDALSRNREVVEKATRTVNEIESWLEVNSRGSKGNDCVEGLVAAASEETLSSLVKLDDLCWYENDWKTSAKKGIDGLISVAGDIRNVYEEFPQLIEECSSAAEGDVELCEENVKVWTQIQITHLLLIMKTYSEFVEMVEKGYYEGGRLCQEVIYQKISWLEGNVVRKLNECIA